MSRFAVQKEMGHGGAQLVDRIYGHMPRNPHRSEAVDYRVERHREELGGRLPAVLARSSEHVLIAIDPPARSPLSPCPPGSPVLPWF